MLLAFSKTDDGSKSSSSSSSDSSDVSGDSSAAGDPEMDAQHGDGMGAASGGMNGGGGRAAGGVYSAGDGVGGNQPDANYQVSVDCFLQLDDILIQTSFQYDNDRSGLLRLRVWQK